MASAMEEEHMRRAVACMLVAGSPVGDLLDRTNLLFVAAVVAPST